MVWIMLGFQDLPCTAYKFILLIDFIFNYCCILIVWTLVWYFRYGSCATARDFEIYAPDASFEDPLMRAQGYMHFFLSLFNFPKI